MAIGVNGWRCGKKLKSKVVRPDEATRIAITLRDLDHPILGLKERGSNSDLEDMHRIARGWMYDY